MSTITISTPNGITPAIKTPTGVNSQSTCVNTSARANTPQRVNIYTNTTPEVVRVITRAVFRKFSQVRELGTYRGEEIHAAVRREITVPTLHIVVCTEVNLEFILLANTLVVKHGIGSVLFVAWDIPESQRLLLEESALWCYTSACEHPTALGNLERSIANMKPSKNES